MTIYYLTLHKKWFILEISKQVNSLSFMQNMGKIYNIYDLYQELYKNEENIEDITNPSSHTSSQFK